MTLIINRQEYTFETESDTITVDDLIKHLEIYFKVDVEKNGLPVDRIDTIQDGDDIVITRFVGAG
ncbi:MAG: thiamine biosynthesis protein ThiS [Spirochaetes bacterium]|nr:thiamine biosynthesis protein ThiS [Spirochaetota bacterium]